MSFVIGLFLGILIGLIIGFICRSDNDEKKKRIFGEGWAYGKQCNSRTMNGDWKLYIEREQK